MRIARKNRAETINSDNPKQSDNSIVSGFNTSLAQTNSLVKPVKNTDEVVEMSESEYLKKFDIKVETFKDQACRVLNLLEKQGINIYSEENTPGMYLRQTGQNISPAGLGQLFRKKNIPQTSENIPDELKSFFKSKNK